MKKYRAASYLGEIFTITIARETDEAIWIKYSGRKSLVQEKKSMGIDYFDTWNEAKDFLLNNINNETKILEARLSYQNARRNEINELVEK